MASLTGRTVRASYIELLKLNTASTNTGVTGSLLDVTDGGNTASALSISTSQIASSVDGSAAAPAFTRKSDTNTGMFFPAADTIAATTTGTERMRITSAGNVGIGTTAPLTTLHLNRTAAGVTTISNADPSQVATYVGAATTTGNYQPLIGVGEGAGSLTAVISSFDDGASAAQGLAFHTGTNSAIAERLRITSTGNVGIGTAAPGGKLHISGGNALIRNTDYLQFCQASNPNGGAAFLRAESDDTFTVHTSSYAKPIKIDASNVLLQTISTGNVGIGTAAPTAQLELSTDSAKKPSTNTWTIASDERLKTNIVDADKNRCYEIVKQVALKRYTWKSEVYSQDKVKDRSKLGWIAQDVEEVFPKAVGTSRFAYNQVFEDVITPELDSEGNAIFDEQGVAKTKTEKRLVSEEVIEDCKDLNSDQIYAAMYGTIQKLIEKVETLEAKVLSLQVA